MVLKAGLDRVDVALARGAGTICPGPATEVAYPATTVRSVRRLLIDVGRAVGRAPAARVTAAPYRYASVVGMAPPVLQN